MPSSCPVCQNRPTSAVKCSSSQALKFANRKQLADHWNNKSDALKSRMLELMWDDDRKFFFPLFRDDETHDGHTVKALTKTYESGKYAGDPHGRELIGYVPWQFNLPPMASKYDVAWKKLKDRDGFYADFGPLTVERNDPMFLVTTSCCWWSGQSWPYATTQTLKALANSMQRGNRTLSKNDYTELLGIYARSHRKNGKPYLAEALNPETGSFEGYDSYNHSEHYFHSGFCDLVITGLAGLVPRDDDTLEIHPLASDEWDYFALDDVPYRGHLVGIVWDRKGDRYEFGKGLHLIVDGKRVGGAKSMKPVRVDGIVPFKASGRKSAADSEALVMTNFAVNNDGAFYPRVTASFTAEGTSLSNVNDGNYWYLLHPPNRWTCEGSPNKKDWLEVDFGVSRTIDTVKLYVLDDREVEGSPIAVPGSILLESWIDNRWQKIACKSSATSVMGRRPHVLSFEPLAVEKLRVTLAHAAPRTSGLTEIETWGKAKLPLEKVPYVIDNLAMNDGTSEFPKATASFHDRFGGVSRSAIDGKTSFRPSPMNRWTSYGSPNKADWLEIDFGKAIAFNRIDIGIYDDRGGVQRPKKYEIEVWQGSKWRPIVGVKKQPSKPAGGQWNTARFETTRGRKIRILFTHLGESKSGVTEVVVLNW